MNLLDERINQCRWEGRNYEMNRKPILAFDTSALNRLADEYGKRDLSCISTIQSGYEVLLPELATGELYATGKFERRKALYEVCRELLNNGCCISPAHWLISSLVKRHYQDPTKFDWSIVPWRCHADEKQIREGTILDDEVLATSQRKRQTESKREFEAGFKKDACSGTQTWNDWINQKERNGELLSIARNLYEPALSYGHDMASVPVARKAELGGDWLGKFVDGCPPFRALVYAYAMTIYDRCCAQKPGGEEYSAGNVDQFMSVYLPYCDEFITAECKRVQERCLQEIVRVAKLATKVSSYDDFRSRVCPGA
jgi:hypothetical protein